ncbi:MAG TPA: zinc-finger domain-containing protein [Caulobacteraceae bacterium]
MASKPKGAPKAPDKPVSSAVTAPFDAPEIITVRSRRVACDGVGGALGHPRVWLEMGEADFVECLYCDRRFVLAKGSEGAEDERLAPGVYEGSHGH